MPAENGGGGDDQHYAEDYFANNTDGGLGSTRAAIGSLATGTKGVVALSLITLPAQAAGKI